MIDAFEEVQQFLDGKDVAEFEADRILQNATIRALEVLGEAASRVSDATRNDS